MILERLGVAVPRQDPFTYVAASGLLSAEDLHAINEDFPRIVGSGLFPLSALTCGPAVENLVYQLQRPAFSALMGEKLGLDLSDLPLMITVRGHCAARDGRPHTDSTDKIATGLLYLNSPYWPDTGGRLRLLRSNDLSDVAAEIPPLGGTLVAFRRSDRSWHGHARFVGQRRYIMFNWVRSPAALSQNLRRHQLSAAFKHVGASRAG